MEGDLEGDSEAGGAGLLSLSKSMVSRSLESVRSGGCGLRDETGGVDAGVDESTRRELSSDKLFVLFIIMISFGDNTFSGVPLPDPEVSFMGLLISLDCRSGTL